MKILLVECQRHPCGVEEGRLAVFPRAAPARHAVPAGNQGRARADRDRSARRTTSTGTPLVKKGYSGTAIFSREQPLSVSNGFPAEFAERFQFADELQRDSAEEGRVMTAEYARFYLVTVYTPNAKDDLSRLALRSTHWDPAFLAHCRQLEARKPVVFCGDLNVAHTELDLAHPKANRGKKGFTDEERRGFQNFMEAGFVDTFRLFKQGNGHYSWWSNFSNARARERRLEDRLHPGVRSRCARR